ncbi:uncharacterized protein BO66DRAFT_68170 [Aspergillus aculeatinus CBS 121060]|uniref:Uncharacterized protein n=1 Tax=Aspergillus aculeatinus CBS 121060 TaxID=1448322 RepID=A0ACD1HN71_9EURO|nr:hypothetical protein BO66DRAFT_68170 [Aspergillus aculeatinus CBS 121060]RAH74860.1 hypothetical protein BO66DRAFT_68170 [Aspergillus aculeatinus CBS 121060]
MAKKGGKSKNKSKSKGGAAAAKKVADTPAAVVPEQEVEETVTKSDAEPETVVTDAGAAVTADATTALPDTVAQGITTAPPADLAQEASTADDASLPKADEPATDVVTEEEPVTVAGLTTTTLPERPKDTAVEPESHDHQAKRPYESSLFHKEEDHKPPKIPKVEEDLDATTSANAVEPVGQEAVGAAAIPADETIVQPQMVPGLGTDPSDNVDQLEAPELSKETAAPVEGAATIPDAAKPATEDAVVDKAVPETVAPVSAAPVTDAAAQPEIIDASEAPATEKLDAPTDVAQTDVAQTDVAPTDVKPETLDEAAGETSKEEAAPIEPLTTAAAAEPAIVVPSSITDADTKATDAAVKSAAESAPAAEAQEPLQAAEEKADTAPAEAAEDKLDAAKAKAPEETTAASKVEEPQPQTTDSQPASAAKDAQKTDEVPSSEIKSEPQETPAVQDTQTAGATEGTTGAQEPESKSAADQGKDTAKLAANRAQESAKSEAAKGNAEKRKTGLWSWLKRKVKGDKN